MWKIDISALTWEKSSCRLVEQFHISAFPCIILYIIGLESMKLQNNEKYLLQIQKRKITQKQAQKDMNEMEWDYLIFSAIRVRKGHPFCSSSHHNVPYEKQQELNKGSEPWDESWLERVRNCTTWRKYLENCSIYIEIGANYESSWVDEWNLSHMV